MKKPLGLDPAESVMGDTADLMALMSDAQQTREPTEAESAEADASVESLLSDAPSGFGEGLDDLAGD